MVKAKFLSERQMAGAVAADNEALLTALGPTQQARLDAVNAIYDAKVATAHGIYFGELTAVSQKGTKTAKPGYLFFRVSRNLGAMTNREREYLRVADLLNVAHAGNWADLVRWKAFLLWGDGQGNLEPGAQTRNPGPPAYAKEMQIGRPQVAELLSKFGTVDMTIDNIQQNLNQIAQSPNLQPDYRVLIEELRGRIAPTGGGAWLTPREAPATIFGAASDYPLHLGSFPDGNSLSYAGEGSITTIAPPGSGKTQCNVFPNLLTWKGPAIVLDISGDIYEHTAGWRAQFVGPVYRFSPLEPESSNGYNPLTFVRNDPDYIWEDARLLAEMMIVPTMSNDPFWENEARTVLTAAIAYVVYYNPPQDRPMHAVLDVLFGGEPWDDMIRGLRMAVDVRVMNQHATALAEMNEKTLSSVLQTARSSMGAWSGERIARCTNRSDWDPADLRSGTMPTVYICIRPNEVEAYLSLLRVFIGQHIRVLTGGQVPERGAPPILVMLDELPRLRYMAPVDEALNIGRKYGLRLWMFAQSVGQLQASYENADGMLGSCAVRIFMNPSGADGVAEKLSEELGYIDSINDNVRKRIVEATELAGPAYKDDQIVVGVGTKPARVRKDFAWQHAELARRMSMPAPIPSAAPAPPPPPAAAPPPPPPPPGAYPPPTSLPAGGSES